MWSRLEHELRVALQSTAVSLAHVAQVGAPASDGVVAFIPLPRRAGDLACAYSGSLPASIVGRPMPRTVAPGVEAPHQLLRVSFPASAATLAVLPGDEACYQHTVPVAEVREDFVLSFSMEPELERAASARAQLFLCDQCKCEGVSRSASVFCKDEHLKLCTACDGKMHTHEARKKHVRLPITGPEATVALDPAPVDVHAYLRARQEVGARGPLHGQLDADTEALAAAEAELRRRAEACRAAIDAEAAKAKAVLDAFVASAGAGLAAARLALRRERDQLEAGEALLARAAQSCRPVDFLDVCAEHVRMRHEASRPAVAPPPTPEFTLRGRLEVASDAAPAQRVLSVPVSERRSIGAVAGLEAPVKSPREPVAVSVPLAFSAPQLPSYQLAAAETVGQQTQPDCAFSAPELPGHQRDKAHDEDVQIVGPDPLSQPTGQEKEHSLSSRLLEPPPDRCGLPSSLPGSESITD